MSPTSLSVVRSALAGAKIAFVNPDRFDYRFKVGTHIVAPDLVGQLAGILVASGKALPAADSSLCDGVKPTAERKAIEEERAKLEAERLQLEQMQREAEQREADRVEAFRLEMKRLEKERLDSERLEEERQAAYRDAMKKFKQQREENSK